MEAGGLEIAPVGLQVREVPEADALGALIADLAADPQRLLVVGLRLDERVLLQGEERQGGVDRGLGPAGAELAEARGLNEQALALCRELGARWPEAAIYTALTLLAL